MGYEETRFVGEIDQEFMCSICTLVLEDAVQSPCEHLFCKQCIVQSLATDTSCPVDRRTLDAADLKPVARFFRNVLAKLMIKCEFEQQGCANVVQLGQLQSHRLECTRNPNAEVVCDKGCNMTMRRDEYEMNDCLTHFSSRLAERDLEIDRLTTSTHCLQEENRHMNDELNQQREEIRQINDANRRLQEDNQHMNDELNQQREENRQTNIDNRRLQEDNQHMNDELNRQREEIRQTNDANRRLQEDNQRMNDELNRQREEIRQNNDANRRLQEDNQRMNGELHVEYRLLQLQINHAPLKWHRYKNIKFTGDAHNFLEGMRRDRTGFAQLFNSLESNFFFGVQILDWYSDSLMVVGLTRKDDPNCDTFGGLEIGYSSNKIIQIDGKWKKVGTRWKNGDTIHCGIKISENPDNKGENFNVVVFLQNGKSIVEKRIEMPSDGLYPTIYMWNCKVRCSTQSNLN